MSKLLQWVTGCFFVIGLTSCAKSPDKPLTYEVYNAGEQGGFAVSSTILYGKKEAMLVDAQFSQQDAQVIADKIAASGKKLTTVYISYPEADYYFGLQTIKARFPDAKVIATAETVKSIQETSDAKLAFWGRITPEKVPTQIVIPEVMSSQQIVFDGKMIDVKSGTGQYQQGAYLWIPSLKLVAGGALTFYNMHPWVANAETGQARQDWVNTLDAMYQLQPEVVVPAHYVGEFVKGPEALLFSRDYVHVFDQVLASQQNAERVITNMEKLYPNLSAKENLITGVKLLKGDYEVVR